MSLIPAVLHREKAGARRHRKDRHRARCILSRPMARSRPSRACCPAPEARFAIHSWEVLRRIMARGDIGLGEEYIAGGWQTDNVEKLISLFLLNLDHLENFSDGNLLNRLGFVIHNALVKRNSVAPARPANIQAHYDVGNDFYRLWLDGSMTYSSALYAGAAKDTAGRRAAEQIWPDPGQVPENPKASVLEIGCGWGGFAERAAAEAGPSCHRADHLAGPATPSPPRAAERRRRRHQSWRIIAKPRGTFDNIVSIEMFEAVGEHLLAAIFRLRVAQAAETRRPRHYPDHYHSRRIVRRLPHAQRFHPPLCVSRRDAALAGALPRGSGERRAQNSPRPFPSAAIMRAPCANGRRACKGAKTGKSWPWAMTSDSCATGKILLLGILRRGLQRRPHRRGAGRELVNSKAIEVSAASGSPLPRLGRAWWR